MVYCIQYLYYSKANKSDVLVPFNPQKDKWLQRELKEGGIPEDKIEALDSKLVDITNNVFEEFKKDLDGIISLVFII